MLVLTRKSNQSIMIGDDIEVSVLSIMGEKVRIGIQAPRDIPVFRKEVYLEIQQENVAAGASARAEVDDALKRLSAAAASAHHDVERLEHHDRHDDGGGDQRQQHQREAQRAVAVRARGLAVTSALLSVTPQPLVPLAVLLDLLEEGLFDLRDALPHPHGSATLAPRQSPARGARQTLAATPRRRRP